MGCRSLALGFVEGLSDNNEGGEVYALRDDLVVWPIFCAQESYQLSLGIIPEVQVVLGAGSHSRVDESAAFS